MYVCSRDNLLYMNLLFSAFYMSFRMALLSEIVCEDVITQAVSCMVFIRVISRGVMLVISGEK